MFSFFSKNEMQKISSIVKFTNFDLEKIKYFNTNARYQYPIRVSLSFIAFHLWLSYPFGLGVAVNLVCFGFIPYRLPFNYHLSAVIGLLFRIWVSTGYVSFIPKSARSVRSAILKTNFQVSVMAFCVCCLFCN